MGRLKILGVKILNEDNPEFFQELLEKGVDAIPIDEEVIKEIENGKNKNH